MEVRPVSPLVVDHQGDSCRQYPAGQRGGDNIYGFGAILLIENGEADTGTEHGTRVGFHPEARDKSQDAGQPHVCAAGRKYHFQQH